MKKEIFKITLPLLILITAITSTNAQQKIQYQFGKDSDVIDTVRSIIEGYKKMYHQTDVGKLNLFVGLDYCDGNINLYISTYSSLDTSLIKLIKMTNRVLPIGSKTYLPILFDTDILVREIADKRALINMNGYYIKIHKDNKYIWKVVSTQITF